MNTHEHPWTPMNSHEHPWIHMNTPENLWSWNIFKKQIKKNIFFFREKIIVYYFFCFLPIYTLGWTAPWAKTISTICNNYFGLGIWARTNTNTYFFGWIAINFLGWIAHWATKKTQHMWFDLASTWAICFKIQKAFGRKRKQRPQP